MKNPMPLPVTANDYCLIYQRGYEVLYRAERPFKVVKFSITKQKIKIKILSFIYNIYHNICPYKPISNLLKNEIEFIQFKVGIIESFKRRGTSWTRY